MKIITAYQMPYGPEAELFPLGINRDWMEKDRFSYHCFPLTLSNKLGFGISLKKDISFIWHGIEGESETSDIDILAGEEYFYFERGGGILALRTNLRFKTDVKTTLLTMPVPNQIIPGVQCLTSLLSTSFYTGEFQVVWKVTEKDRVITVPAGTPIAAILPISLTDLQDSKILIKKDLNDFVSVQDTDEYATKLKEYGKIDSRPAGLYKQGLDKDKNHIGLHEVSKINLIVERE